MKWWAWAALGVGASYVWSLHIDRNRMALTSPCPGPGGHIGDDLLGSPELELHPQPDGRVDVTHRGQPIGTLWSCDASLPQPVHYSVVGVRTLLPLFADSASSAVGEMLTAAQMRSMMSHG